MRMLERERGLYLLLGLAVGDVRVRVRELVGGGGVPAIVMSLGASHGVSLVTGLVWLGWLVWLVWYGWGWNGQYGNVLVML